MPASGSALGPALARCVGVAWADYAGFVGQDDGLHVVAEA
jgi:hypothetical protein